MILFYFGILSLAELYKKGTAIELVLYQQVLYIAPASK